MKIVLGGRSFRSLQEKDGHVPTVSVQCSGGWSVVIRTISETRTDERRILFRNANGKRGSISANLGRKREIRGLRDSCD